MSDDLELSRAAASGLLVGRSDAALGAKYLTKYCLWPAGRMLDEIVRQVALGTSETELRQRIHDYTEQLGELDDQP